MKKILYIIALIIPLLIATPALAQDISDEAFGETLGIFFLCCLGLIAIVLLALFVFWIFMLVDCIKRENDQFPNASENTKTIWLIVLLVSWILGLNWLAAIIYYFMVKKKMPI